MKEWILIDWDFKDKLPKTDCKIWITRVFYTGKRWVQKIDYYSFTKDIEYDGTIAWMIANENDIEPEPCVSINTMTIQNVR